NGSAPPSTGSSNTLAARPPTAPSRPPSGAGSGRRTGPAGRLGRRRRHPLTLSEALERLDLVEEGRADRSTPMEGDRHAPAIGTGPSLVASGLSTPDEAELTRHALELPRSGARHSRFRWCPWGGGGPAPDTPRRSCRRPDSAPPTPLRA